MCVYVASPSWCDQLLRSSSACRTHTRPVTFRTPSRGNGHFRGKASHPKSESTPSGARDRKTSGGLLRKATPPLSATVGDSEVSFAERKVGPLGTNVSQTQYRSACLRSAPSIRVRVVGNAYLGVESAAAGRPQLSLETRERERERDAFERVRNAYERDLSDSVTRWKKYL